VRLELVGDAPEIAITYETKAADTGIRGEGGGVTFQIWRGGELVDEDKAVHGEGIAHLRTEPSKGHTAIVYIPEGMRPSIKDIEPVGGEIRPAPLQPRWVAYGDSVAEGWLASAPALAWPHIAAREHSLDVVNMGYAGSARGETVSAEHIAEIEAAVISITHGTNCWNRIPHSVAQMRANTEAFLHIVRHGHRDAPIVVASPILRPDAEASTNRLGATLNDLRVAMEDVIRERIAAGDANLRLIEGLGILTEAQLADGIHPNDDGHVALAAALGPVVKEMCG